MSRMDLVRAIESTEEWIRYMRRRIDVLLAQKMKLSRKRQTIKTNMQELEAVIISHRLSKWNRDCLDAMKRGMDRAKR